MMDSYEGYYSSPLGTIRVTYTAKGISSLVFIDDPSSPTRDDLFLQSCFSQLDDYFEGTLRQFDLETDLKGSDFQMQVWQYLLTIPFGKTVTYMDVAKKINNPGAVRAVGYANGKNPVSIIIPCHRVIGSDGSLTGYAGGLWRKHWLLEHEHKSEQLSLF